MEGLADFITQEDGAKVLILYDTPEDLDRGLDAIAERWQVFQMVHHEIYKIADEKKQPWSETVRIDTKSLNEAQEWKAKEYDQVIVINPQVNVDYFRIHHMEGVDDNKRFYLVLEPKQIRSCIGSYWFDPVGLKWMLDKVCEQGFRRKRTSLVIVEESESEESESE